ncbi:DMT family transporter [Hydrogenophaga sp. 5NK40-0174]|uniref:DMT family transporter n=1 Tax=Hydrogenophaga sp. 5NK40-0174 TaxID=3127649 RepID=UPI00310BAA7D
MSTSSPAGAAEESPWITAIPAVFVLIWSTGFIVARFGMPHAPPMSFLAWRFALSILCFGVWIVLARVAWPSSRQQVFHLAVTGVLMHAGYLGGVWAAVKAGMGAGLSALIVGLQPVLTAIWVTLMDRSQPRISRRQWAGLSLGLLGLLLVVWRKITHGSPGDQANAVNLLFAFGALISITAGTLYQKRFVKPCDVRSANAVQLTAALVVALPLAFMETESVRWTAQLSGAMAWSVLGLTLGGSSLLYLLIQRGAAATVASLMYLVPPCTAVIALILFDEPISMVTLCGIVITAVGVSLVVRSPKSVTGHAR